MLTNSIVNDIYNMGDRTWLKSNNIFCFGNRRTGKTTNMLLKAILSYLENPRDQFRINLIVPNKMIGRNYLQHMADIASRFSWRVVILVSKPQLHIFINGDEIIFDVITTEDSVRGTLPNFIIFDEPEFYSNKRDLIRGAFISTISNNCDFVIGGGSYNLE